MDTNLSLCFLYNDNKGILILIGNLWSLAKLDEFQALTRAQWECREWSIKCFTETWLQDHIPDSNVSLLGFLTVQAERDLKSSGKRKRGGVAVLVIKDRLLWRVASVVLIWNSWQFAFILFTNIVHQCYFGNCLLRCCRQCSHKFCCC